MNRKQGMNQITEGNILRQLLLFFFPILLGTFFQQLYNTVDTVIVGQFVGTEALSAVGGSTASLVNLVIGFFVGLSTGATVIISQFFGGRRTEEVRNSIGTAIALALAVGAVVMVLCLFFSEPLLKAMDTPAETLADSVLYMKIYAVGMIPALIYNMGSAILRAMGDSKRPLYFLITACGLNIVLDLLFVVALHMSVMGVALATMISQYVSALFVMLILCRRLGEFSLSLKNIRFHGNYLLPMVRIGLPAGIQAMTYSFSNILIQTVINSFGTGTVAAWAAYARLDAIFWMVLNAIGVSVTTFAGQNYGAGKRDRIRKSIRICLIMAAAVSLGATALMLNLPGQLLGIFTRDAEVVAIGTSMIRIIGPFYITYIFVEILSGAARGCGKVLVPTVMSLLGICGLRIFWLLAVIPAHHSVEMICWSYPLTWVVTSIGYLIFYFTSDIRKVRETQSPGRHMQ